MWFRLAVRIVLYSVVGLLVIGIGILATILVIVGLVAISEFLFGTPEFGAGIMFLILCAIFIGWMIIDGFGYFDEW